jgi:antitoxin component YwqK of YwqJK toxin-antitoxin module|tara:strand:- start:15 stop:605 length:591 start_codon:yes stop_codon:yes gene_type:complete
MTEKLNGLHTEVTGKGYKIETHFTEGVRDGKETIWYSNGNKRSEIDYKRVWNSKKHPSGFSGPEIVIRGIIPINESNTAGGFVSPTRKGEADDYIDCIDGKEIYFYEETGKKESEYNYLGGFQNGKQTRWYSNGQKSHERFMKLRLSGVTYHGTETNWHPNGQKSYEKHYKDDYPYGIWTEWDENGKVVFEHDCGD